MKYDAGEVSWKEVANDVNLKFGSARTGLSVLVRNSPLILESEFVAKVILVVPSRLTIFPLVYSLTGLTQSVQSFNMATFHR